MASDQRSKHEVTSSRFVIATQGEASSRAAQMMFELGGNAVDAAAAASFAIAVERPQSTSLSGCGFMLIHFSGQKSVVALDFHTRAPGAATEQMFQDSTGNVVPGLSTDGILSVAVPGVVAGVLNIPRQSRGV